MSLETSKWVVLSISILILMRRTAAGLYPYAEVNDSECLKITEEHKI